jgi:tyrosine-protein kinase Etk/Wzc
VDYRSRHRVGQASEEQESRTQELISVEGQERENSNAIARLSAQVEEVKAQLEREPAINRILDGRGNPQRAELERRLAELEAQRAALQTEYREASRQFAPVDAQIRDIKRRLASEPQDRFVGVSNAARADLLGRLKDLERELQGRRAEGRQLEAQVVRQRDRVSKLGQMDVQLAELQRRRTAAEKAFLILDETVQDLAIRENARRTTASILERAFPARTPVRPRPGAYLLMAAMVGVTLGMSGALLREYFDDRVTTAADVDRALAMDVLGRVPFLPAGHSLLVTELPPLSPQVESYRALRSALNFAALDQPLRTLVVSSAAPGEGKSVTAVNLAIAMAASGRRVILVDADLRRPTLHRFVGWEPSPGLSEVLSDSYPLLPSLRPFPGVPGLQLLTSGALAPNPAELLESAGMERLIKRLADAVDAVILDCPPCLPVTDAAVLSAKVDGVLLVADINRARLEILQRAREQFDRAKARLVGLVFNKVSRHEVGSYGYYCRRGYYPSSSEGGIALTGNGHSDASSYEAMADPRTADTWMPHGPKPG